MPTTRKTNVYLAVKNPAALPGESARKLIEKIKARFKTLILLFWHCLLLIYAAILTVPQKPKHARNGRQPYVLAHDCPGKAATAAPAYLERIEQGLDRAEAQKERETRLGAIQAVSTGHKIYDPVREYQRQAQRILTKYGDKADLSRMDWMIATDMAKSGNWTQQDVEKGIREASPALESRKTGHIEDYAKRTAEKAWAAPEVQEHRKEQERQAQRGGPGLSR